MDNSLEDSEEFKPITEEYTKCAPSKHYSDGSCFTIDSLKKIAEAHNRFVGGNSNKLIKIIDSKQYLVTKLSKIINECGADQLCWLNVKWVKQIKDYDIHNNTFRPLGPQGRFKWLSTTNINDIVGQYEKKYSDFKFLGAVPLDFEDIPVLGLTELNLDQLVKLKKTKLGLVINLDEHWKRGSHWVGLYINLLTNSIYFFDSYGFKPKNKICQFVKKISLWCYKRNILNVKYGKKDDIDLYTESKFMKNKINKYEGQLDVKYNKVRHQYKNSECGIYSVNFILRLLNGDTFNNICNNITSDDKVNQCRQTYFRFK